MFDLKLDHVSKRYRVRQEADADASRNRLVRKLQSLRRRSQEFWAVRDVSFEVKRGEALGIIGHNGAGKSTILKLLSSITAPTQGEITINGRLSALIEVGSGFHPELTGRENVYLSGSILGMRRREIAEKLDSIVEFAGVRQFIDTPVKRYSSGMYVRLGFSIAAHLDPDILLLDEVLAVGDAAFQSKCLQRINELKEMGTTIVFISHDLGAVERLCDRALLLRQGEVIAGGSPREVVAEYRRVSATFATPSLRGEKIIDMSHRARVTALNFYDAENNEASVFHTGGPLVARMSYAAFEEIEDAVLEVFFYSQDDKLNCQLTTEVSGTPLNLEPGTGTVEFLCPELGLQPGLYYVDVVIKQRGAPKSINWQARRTTLRVDPGKIVRGQFYAPHEWRMVEQRSAVNESATVEQPIG